MCYSIKDGEMSLSSSRWILTLVLDINVYDNFITQLTADIKNAKNVTEWISKHYSHTDMAGYLSVFRSLQDEVITLEEMNNDIKQSFLNSKTLKNRPKKGNPRDPLWCTWLYFWKQCQQLRSQ